MAKKIMKFIIAAVICVLLIPTSALAGEAMQIVVDRVEIEPGIPEVEVNISIPNNPGIALIAFDVNYDSLAMTLKTAAAGNIFPGGLDCNLAKVPFTFNVYTGEGNKTASGILVTLKFELNPNCDAKTYDIAIERVEALNIDENPIECSVANGYVKVTGPPPPAATLPVTVDANGGAPPHEVAPPAADNVGKADVKATFPQEEQKPGKGAKEEHKRRYRGFVDVPANAWYADAVGYVFTKGLMQGTSATEFSPNMKTNRAMIVTILYRLENEPAAGVPAFTDVSAGQYYAKAVAWASANGIVAGYDNGKFGPEDPITREQMAAILYRYAQYKGYTLEAAADLNQFSDVSAISGYAMEALRWANTQGLIQGMGDGTLAPQANATRAQVASILMRFCENTAR